MSWAGGYVADSPYRIAFQPSQMPAHLAMVCALAGVDWQLRERMHVADLGCGRGYAVNVLAAANPEWTVLGLDHNPVHVAEGMQLAAQSGLGNALFQEVDFAAMTDAEMDRIPPLDVAMLHGVWTWVSDAVRAGILRLLARRLKPGGIAYVGYNALPAAGADAALQRLLRHLASGHAGPAGDAAAHAMARLRAMAPHLPLRRSAMLARLLAEPAMLEPAFVAHEFLTEHWRPVFHEDLCGHLRQAKLEFVGSGNLFEAMPSLFCGPTELALLEAMPVGPAHEMMKDLALPRSFRADVFVRGARRVAAGAALEHIVLAATRPLPAESRAMRMGAAEMMLAQPVWQVLAEALAQGPHTLGALRRRMGTAAPTAAELLILLVGNDHAMPAFRPAVVGAATSRFNRAAAAMHGGAGAGHFALASPVLAGGLPATAPEMALVAELLQGAASSDDAIVAERAPVWRRFGIV